MLLLLLCVPSCAGPAAPVPLIDARPLPGTFVDLQFIGAEGPSAYWHWKHLNNFQVSRHLPQPAMMSDVLACMQTHATHMY